MNQPKEFILSNEMHKYLKRWNENLQFTARGPQNEDLGLVGRFKAWAEWASLLHSILYETWDRLIDQQRTIEYLQRKVNELDYARKCPECRKNDEACSKDSCGRLCPQHDKKKTAH